MILDYFLWDCYGILKFYIIFIVFSKVDILYGNIMGFFDFSFIFLLYDLEIIKGIVRLKVSNGDIIFVY